MAVLTKIHIVVLVAACALVTATVTTCVFVLHHAYQQRQDEINRQALIKYFTPPANLKQPGIM
jgi:hypothetical protein